MEKSASLETEKMDTTGIYIHILRMFTVKILKLLACKPLHRVLVHPICRKFHWTVYVKKNVFFSSNYSDYTIKSGIKI